MKMDVKSIPVSSIIADPSFNVRQDAPVRNADGMATAQSVEDLADQIKRDGRLINPLVVSPADGKGKHRLVVGFRRFEAVSKILKWTEVPVQIQEGTEEDLYYLNLIENLARKDLTTYEIAHRCALLSTKFKTSGTDISKRLGGRWSKATVDNYIRLVTKLHPKIMDEWRKGHGLARVTDLLTLASMDDKDDQWEEWEKRCAAQGQPAVAAANGKGPKKRGKEGVRNLETLKACLAAVRKSDAAAKWKEGAEEALLFALKKSDNLGDVFDPKAEEKEAKQAKEEEKLEKAMKAAQDKLNEIRKKQAAVQKGN